MSFGIITLVTPVLSVVMLSVVILNVVMLSVLALTEKVSLFTMILTSIYNKKLCFYKPKCVLEHFRR
jgi:hypothetical protein